MSLILMICGVLAVLAGLAGLLLPLLPGAPLLLLGLVLCAWAEGFRHVGPWTLALLTGMAGLTYLAEFIGTALGVSKFGGSGRAMLGATAGGLIGMLFGLPGIIAGPFIGAVLGELSLLRSLDQAGRAGFGTVVGMALAAGGKVAVGIVMVGIFLAVRLL